MTRAEISAERRGLTIGTICGVFATLTAGSALVLVLRVVPLDALVYLVRVLGFVLVAVGFTAGAAWVTWRALSWARGGGR
jgi:hypothetical protein